MKQRTILIGKKSYFFLKDEARRQRGCSQLTDADKDRIWKRMPKDWDKYMCTEDSFGGGDGTKDYTKWTTWSIETVKDMLHKAGLEYEDGPEIEVSYL